MAHDLRSPLTAIMCLAEHEQNGRVSEAQRQALGLIYSAAWSLCATASDVVEFARGGTRLVGPRAEPFALSEVFASVRDTVLPLAVVKGLDVRFALPSSDRQMGHPRALSRVLLNLTTNAVKFTDAGYVEVAARSVEGTGVEFSVRDTGPGFDTGELQPLYQPFQKTESDCRQSFSSSGLGLAICRKLIRAMGGELHVASAPRHGTRFFFTVDLPQAPRLRADRAAA